MTLLVLSGIISVTKRQSEAEAHVFNELRNEVRSLTKYPICTRDYLWNREFTLAIGSRFP
jgi:hypothetical protein